MRQFKNILITGGAGFIGSHLIRYLFNQPDFIGRVVNLDKLTYAGNLSNLADIEAIHGVSQRYQFIQGDICDTALVEKIFAQASIEAVIHLAAESHVDRSIFGPAEFIRTNIEGTFSLLEVARKVWSQRKMKEVLFYHVSTDEVYGSLGDKGHFTEETPYAPRSPYSASKASSDHLVQAYFHTYRLPVVISNCSNNYGPCQYPEKLLPLMILNMLAGKPLPIYGDGQHVRDWLYVEDHCSAIWTILRRGQIGQTYNIGGENEWENIRLVRRLCELVAQESGRAEDAFYHLITFVQDRSGHDRRYAIDCSKLKQTLGWRGQTSFDDGLRKTVRWYLNN